MEIHLRTVNHRDHRYNTVGDYYFDANIMVVNVSKIGNRDYEFLVAIHEIIECYLADSRGIKEQDITSFDLQHTGDGEAGDEKDCPYRREHFFSETVERLLANELGVNWNDYELALDNVSRTF